MSSLINVQARQTALFSATQTKKVSFSRHHILMLAQSTHAFPCLFSLIRISMIKIVTQFQLFFSSFYFVVKFSIFFLLVDPTDVGFPSQVEDLARLSFQTTPVYIDVDDGRTKVDMLLLLSL